MKKPKIKAGEMESGIAIIAEIDGETKYIDLDKAGEFLKFPDAKEKYRGIVCYTILDPKTASKLIGDVLEYVREDQETD